MAHRKVNSPKHLEKGEILFWDTPSKAHKNAFLCIFFLHIPINHDVEASELIEFPFLGAI